MFLQVSNATLPAVGPDERVQRLCRQLQLRVAEAAVLARGRDQVLLGYRQLLFRYVSWSKCGRLADK